MPTKPCAPRAKACVCTPPLSCEVTTMMRVGSLNLVNCLRSQSPLGPGMSSQSRRMASGGDLRRAFQAVLAVA